MITENLIHYAKCSIRQWNGNATRFKINMDVVGVNAQHIQKFTWLMTAERREVFNGLKNCEDEQWAGYQDAVDVWKGYRKEYGNSVKLYIGKLHTRKAYIKGQSQLRERVPNAVCLALWHKEDEYMKHIIQWEDFSTDRWFHEHPDKVYNLVWDWRNPGTSKSSGRIKKVAL